MEGKVPWPSWPCSSTGGTPVARGERCKVFFFLHVGQSPPELAEPPQPHFRCRVREGKGVSKGGTAAGFIGICSRMLIRSTDKTELFFPRPHGGEGGPQGGG